MNLRETFTKRINESTQSNFEKFSESFKNLIRKSLDNKHFHHIEYDKVGGYFEIRLLITNREEESYATLKRIADKPSYFYSILSELGWVKDNVGNLKVADVAGDYDDCWSSGYEFRAKLYINLKPLVIK